MPRVNRGGPVDPADIPLTSCYRTGSGPARWLGTHSPHGKFCALAASAWTRLTVDVSNGVMSSDIHLAGTSRQSDAIQRRFFWPGRKGGTVSIAFSTRRSKIKESDR